jgi:hypothetical protein
MVRQEQTPPAGSLVLPLTPRTRGPTGNVVPTWNDLQFAGLGNLKGEVSVLVKASA